MSRMALFVAVLSTSLAAWSFGSAQSRVCVEELNGVCLKYEEVRQVSRAEQTERSLDLDAAERRIVQRGLATGGFYSGGIDGALGPRSRTALRRWQEANGLLATGYLTLDQVAMLKAAAGPSAPVVGAAPPAAPEPEPVISAPASAPSHPEPGRVYREQYFNLQGNKVVGTLRRIDDGRAEVTVRIEEVGVFEQSCIVPIAGEFSCYMRQPRWNMRIMSGTLPRVVVQTTEAVPQYADSSAKEEFVFW